MTVRAVASLLALTLVSPSPAFALRVIEADEAHSGVQRALTSAVSNPTGLEEQAAVVRTQHAPSSAISLMPQGPISVDRAAAWVTSWGPGTSADDRLVIQGVLISILNYLDLRDMQFDEISRTLRSGLGLNGQSRVVLQLSVAPGGAGRIVTIRSAAGMEEPTKIAQRLLENPETLFFVDLLGEPEIREFLLATMLKGIRHDGKVDPKALDGFPREMVDSLLNLLLHGLQWVEESNLELSTFQINRKAGQLLETDQQHTRLQDHAARFRHKREGVPESRLRDIRYWADFPHLKTLNDIEREIRRMLIISVILDNGGSLTVKKVQELAKRLQLGDLGILLEHSDVRQEVDALIQDGCLSQPVRGPRQFGDANDRYYAIPKGAIGAVKEFLGKRPVNDETRERIHAQIDQLRRQKILEALSAAAQGIPQLILVAKQREVELRTRQSDLTVARSVLEPLQHGTPIPPDQFGPAFNTLADLLEHVDGKKVFSGDDLSQLHALFGQLHWHTDEALRESQQRTTFVGSGPLLAFFIWKTSVDLTNVRAALRVFESSFQAEFLEAMRLYPKSQQETLDQLKVLQSQQVNQIYWVYDRRMRPTADLITLLGEPDYQNERFVLAEFHHPDLRKRYGRFVLLAFDGDGVPSEADLVAKLPAATGMEEKTDGGRIEATRKALSEFRRRWGALRDSLGEGVVAQGAQLTSPLVSLETALTGDNPDLHEVLRMLHALHIAVSKLGPPITDANEDSLQEPLWGAINLFLEVERPQRSTSIPFDALRRGGILVSPQREQFTVGQRRVDGTIKITPRSGGGHREGPSEILTRERYNLGGWRYTQPLISDGERSRQAPEMVEEARTAGMEEIKVSGPHTVGEALDLIYEAYSTRGFNQFAQDGVTAPISKLFEWRTFKGILTRIAGSEDQPRLMLDWDENNRTVSARAVVGTVGNSKELGLRERTERVAAVRNRLEGRPPTRREFFLQEVPARALGGAALGTMAGMFTSMAFTPLVDEPVGQAKASRTIPLSFDDPRAASSAIVVPPKASGGDTPELTVFLKQNLILQLKPGEKSGRFTVALERDLSANEYDLLEIAIPKAEGIQTIIVRPLDSHRFYCGEVSTVSFSGQEIKTAASKRGRISNTPSDDSRIKWLDIQLISSSEGQQSAVVTLNARAVQSVAFQTAMDRWEAKERAHRATPYIGAAAGVLLGVESAVNNAPADARRTRREFLGGAKDRAYYGPRVGRPFLSRLQADGECPPEFSVHDLELQIRLGRVLSSGMRGLNGGVLEALFIQSPRTALGDLQTIERFLSEVRSQPTDFYQRIERTQGVALSGLRWDDRQRSPVDPRSAIQAVELDDLNTAITLARQGIGFRIVYRPSEVKTWTNPATAFGFIYRFPTGSRADSMHELVRPATLSIEPSASPSVISGRLGRIKTGMEEMVFDDFVRSLEQRGVELSPRQHAAIQRAHKRGATHVLRIPMVEAPDREVRATIYTDLEWQVRVHDHIPEWQIGLPSNGGTVQFDAAVYPKDPEGVRTPAVGIRDAEEGAYQNHGMATLLLESVADVDLLEPQLIWATATDSRLTGRAIKVVSVLILHNEREIYIFG